jgi:hypothetical protein
VKEIFEMVERLLALVKDSNLTANEQQAALESAAAIRRFQP